MSPDLIAINGASLYLLGCYDYYSIPWYARDYDFSTVFSAPYWCNQPDYDQY